MSSIAKIFYLGILASGVASVITHPFDVIKTRMQLEPGIKMKNIIGHAIVYVCNVIF